MIASKDRSGYIGASDTDKVMGNWETLTFKKWWQEKMGWRRNDFTNDAMMTGNALEHRILDALCVPGMEKDKQIIKGRWRVNLDGNTNDCIYEVKTYRLERVYKPPKRHIQQVRVEMLAANINKAYIVSYGLRKEDYNNWYLPIDLSRIDVFPVAADDEFTAEYMKRKNFLEKCLKCGIFPA